MDFLLNAHHSAFLQRKVVDDLCRSSRYEMQFMYIRIYQDYFQQHIYVLEDLLRTLCYAHLFHFPQRQQSSCFLFFPPFFLISVFPLFSISSKIFSV